MPVNAPFPLISASDVAHEEFAGPLNLSINSGENLIVLTPREKTGEELVRLLLGIDRTETGTVRLFDQDLSVLSARELLPFRRRVGVVSTACGLISNLNAVENVLLPALYHLHALPDRPTPETGAAALRRAGYQESPLTRPYLLTHRQRMQVALARAMLMEPEVMIYDGIERGLDMQERLELIELTRTFQEERPTRAALFITTDKDLPSHYPEAAVVSLARGTNR